MIDPIMFLILGVLPFSILVGILVWVYRNGEE